MERDLDKKLYNDYLTGERQAFEYLYNKYKSKVVSSKVEKLCLILFIFLLFCDNM